MLSNRINQRKHFLLLISRNTSTTNDAKSMQAPNPRKINSDMVGPPDPVSNLRKIIYKQPSNETELEKKYRELRMEVQNWNHNFWTQHNSRFFQLQCPMLLKCESDWKHHLETSLTNITKCLIPKEREDYLKKNLPEGKQNLTADEMSVFYKAFLDKNWKSHINYNIEWYKKNVTLLGLAIQVKFNRLFKLKSSK